MTNEQLAELKKMSAGQIARKYTPYLIKKQITREQFDQLVKLGVQVEAEPQNAPLESASAAIDTVSQFTTHDDEVAGRTQKQKLLEVLKDGAWHPTTEILGKVYGLDHSGIARIGARIHDLKEDGHRIESEKLKDSVWQYRLVEQSVLVPDGQTKVRTI
jgi:hypothetical protein